jgi:signal transduction histidine kinase
VAGPSDNARVPRARSIFLRYALAVVTVGIAAGLTRLLVHLGDPGISPLFFAAVLVSAWYGGIGPGLLATLLSGLLTAWLLVHPHGFSVLAVQEHVLRLLVFTVVSVLTGALHAATRRAAAESARARAIAESANRAKTQFLAMVSHELRTPLAPVAIAAELLETDPSLPENLKADVQTIRRHVAMEMRIIDDLVDLTLISSGRMSLKMTAVDVHEPLTAAIRVCQPDADAKRLKLTTHFDAARTFITGDPVRLQQVFWNLLRNAIKFTPEAGAISITTTDTGSQLCIEVADTGIGIDPQKLPVIFEAFEQGGEDVQVRFGGMGLGLAICQALVRAHGGAISVQSAGKEKGATFTLTFPFSGSAEGTRSLAPEDTHPFTPPLKARP